VTIDGLNFWGSPITPNFFEAYWAFNRSRGEIISRYWDMIPQITDVLITHGPPHDIMDLVPDGKKVGCEELRLKVDYDLPRLKLHVFGHIHDGYGKRKIDNKTFVNASICTEQYVPKNPPIQVEL
jgi:Icc-related predicted phosphoesterase